MWFGMVSLFPEAFKAVTDFGITGRAIDTGVIEMAYFNPRDFAEDKQHTVDDKPYGGGPGMLMKVDPLRRAIGAAREVKSSSKVICLSPSGHRLDQEGLKKLAICNNLILISGRYEGVDERILEQEVDLEVSIGDYVISGGELAAMVLVDGLTRLLPGGIGCGESVERDSFFDGLLEYPQYTRPAEILEYDEAGYVPEVLVSGNHQEIAKWRHKQALGKTYERRPDLMKKYALNDSEKKLLEEYIEDQSSD